MSTVLYEKEEYLELAHTILNNHKIKNMAIPIFERIKLERYVKPEGIDKAIELNIISWIERLYISNQMTYFYQYRDVNPLIEYFGENDEIQNYGHRFKIYTKQKVEVYKFLNSLSYNLDTNSGRSFISEEDRDRLKNLRTALARKVIDEMTTEIPLHY